MTLQIDDRVTFLAQGLVDSVGQHGEVYIRAYDHIFCRRQDEVATITEFEQPGVSYAKAPPPPQSTDEALTLLTVVQLLDAHLLNYTELMTRLQIAAMRCDTVATAKLSEAISAKVAEIITTAVTIAVLSNVPEDVLLDVFRHIASRRGELVQVYREAVDADTYTQHTKQDSTSADDEDTIIF